MKIKTMLSTALVAGAVAATVAVAAPASAATVQYAYFYGAYQAQQCQNATADLRAQGATIYLPCQTTGLGSTKVGYVW